MRLVGGIVFALSLAGCGLGPWEERAHGGGLEGETLTLAGQVLDTDGNPAARSRVTLRTRDIDSGNEEGVLLASAADSEGRYQFKAIPPGDYFLTAHEDDGPAALFREIHLAAPRRHDSVVVVGPDTLKSLGAIRGSISIPAGLAPRPIGAVQVPGLGRLTTIDSTGMIWIDQVPPGRYYLRILYNSMGLSHKVDNVVVRAADTTDIGQFTLNPPGTEDLSVWPHTLPVRINTTATGAGMATDIQDFPILFRLDSANFPFHQVGAPGDGADIRFTDAAGRQLDYEIERWSFPDRRALIWVKLDTLFGDRNDQIVNIHFGKPDVFSTSGARSTFDTAFGHAAVWHFSGYHSAGLLADATPNKNNLRVGATVNTVGLVGNGRAVGSGDELARGPAVSLIPASFTLSAWIRPEGMQSEKARLFWKERVGSPVAAYSLTWLGKAGALEFAVATTGAKPGTVSAVAPLPAGQNWIHVAATYNSATGVGSLFINGKEVGTFKDTSSVEHGLPGDLILGAQSGGLNAFQGLLDEIRISRMAHSAARIALEYESQKFGSRLLVFP